MNYIGKKARIYSFTTLFQQLNRNFAIEFTNSPAYPTPPQTISRIIITKKNTHIIF